MEPCAAHLASLRHDSAAIVAAARDNLDRPIAHCPGWTMSNLLVHLGRGMLWQDVGVQAFTEGDTTVEGIQAKRKRLVTPPNGPQIVGWFDDTARAFAATLETLDPHDRIATMMWNIECGTNLFPTLSAYHLWALETAVHRWDSQFVDGNPEPIANDLAVDWLDQIFGCWLVAAAERGRQAQGTWAGETITFQSSTSTDQWAVTLKTPGKVTVSRDGPTNADISIRGTAGDLLLLAMNRIPTTSSDLQVVGDLDVFARWVQTIRYGTAVPSATTAVPVTLRDRKSETAAP